MGETTIIKGCGSVAGQMKPLMRVAAYCRVSTDSAEQATSFESQRKYFTDKIMSTDGWILADIYADEGITGTSIKKRKDFQRMIDDCMAGKIDMIITKSLSRFSRNTEDTLKYVRILRDRSIPIIFEEEHINTCSMEGELLLTVLGAVYQQEVENTSNHVKLGMKMKMKRGEMLGQPRAYGYDYDKASKSLLINPQEAEVVRWIFEQYVAGLGGRRIAIELEKRGIKAPKSDYWNAGVIVGIIKNEKYKGDLLLGKTYVNNPIQRKTCRNFGERDRFYVKKHHVAIVEPELFDRAQEVLKERQQRFARNVVTGKHRAPPEKGPFSMKLYCANCGRCLIKRHTKKSPGVERARERWQCSGYANHVNGCKKIKEWEADWIEKAFVSSFNLLCRQGKPSMDAFLDTMKSVLRKKERGRKSVKKSVLGEVERIQEQMNVLLNQHMEGDVDEGLFRARYAALRKELESAREMAEGVDTQEDKTRQLEARIRGMQERLRKYGPLEEFDADVFSAVVDRVIVGVIGEGESEYITFIYRDGEKNSFDIGEFRKAVELKRQLNMVSAYQNNDESNSCADACSLRTSKGRGRSCTTNRAKDCLRYKMSTDGDTALTHGDAGAHGLQVKAKEDCSTHSVKEHLHYYMSTDGAGEAAWQGATASSGSVGNDDDRSTHSVNKSLHYDMSTDGDDVAAWQGVTVSSGSANDDEDCSMHSVNRGTYCCPYHGYYGYGCYSEIHSGPCCGQYS